MSIVRPISGMIAFPVRKILTAVKIEMPVKSFNFYPLIPSQTTVEVNKLKELVAKINPDLKLPDNIKEWREATLNAFVDRLVHSCLHFGKFDLEKLEWIEARRLKRKLEDLGIYIEKLGFDLSLRPRINEVLLKLKDALVGSSLGKEHLAVLAETKEDFKIQVPTLEDVGEIDIINKEYIKLMGNYADLFINKHIHDYFEPRLKIARSIEWIMPFLITANLQGHKLVDFLINMGGKIFGAENFNINIGAVPFLAVSMPLLLTVSGINHKYFEGLKRNWQTAYESAEAIIKLEGLLKPPKNSS